MIERERLLRMLDVIDEAAETEWRIVEEPRSSDRLPGPKGTVDLVVKFQFVTERWHSERVISDLTLDGGQLTVHSGGERIVLRPAKTTKRARKLPVPEFSLGSFLGYLELNGRYEPELKVRHRVKVLTEAPDPNRVANSSDALVTAVCGRETWVQPKYFEPTEGLFADCPGCYPRPPR